MSVALRFLYGAFIVGLFVGSMTHGWVRVVCLTLGFVSLIVAVAIFFAGVSQSEESENQRMVRRKFFWKARKRPGARAEP